MFRCYHTGCAKIIQFSRVLGFSSFPSFCWTSVTSFAAISAAHKHDCPIRSCNPKVNYYTAKYYQLYIVVQKCNILLTITCFPRYNFASWFNKKGECGIFFFFLPCSERHPAWKCFQLKPCTLFYNLCNSNIFVISFLLRSRPTTWRIMMFFTMIKKFCCMVECKTQKSSLSNCILLWVHLFQVLL